MDGKAIALLGALGLGLLAAGGSRRSGRAGGGGREAARRRLAASDAEARRPGFVDPEGERRLTVGAQLAATEDGALVELDAIAPADPKRARALAAPLYRALRLVQRPGPVSRDDVRAFQVAAGLAPSGLYDRPTFDALKRYGIRRPPEPWFLTAEEGTS